MKKFLIILAAVVAGIGLLIQLVPYGHNHTNPPVLAEPQWDSPETRALAQRACFDCHSNETVWPWYSNVAPVSWLIVRDVEEGRFHFNLSEWNSNEEHHHQHSVDFIVEVLKEGEMPPPQYVLMHPEAKLSDAERQALIEGLEHSLGDSHSHGGE